VQGSWTSDNNGPSISLNGQATGVSNSGDFANLSTFLISSGFKTGENVIDFLVVNAGTDANPTGLRVQGLRADGVKGAAVLPRLAVAAIAGGQVRVSWPVSVTGFQLYSKDSLSSSAWALVNSLVTIDGDGQGVSLTPGGAAAFYRLQK